MFQSAGDETLVQVGFALAGINLCLGQEVDYGQCVIKSDVRRMRERERERERDVEREKHEDVNKHGVSLSKVRSSNA